MDERDGGQVAEAVWRALEARDWEAASGLLHEDFVQEWPQSGERIVGREGPLPVDMAVDLALRVADHRSQPVSERETLVRRDFCSTGGSARDGGAKGLGSLVIPNECEESKADFSLRSKQGFLAEPVLSIAEGLEMII